MAGWAARMTGVMNLCHWGEFGPAKEFVLPVVSSRLAVHWARDPLPALSARYIFSCRRRGQSLLLSGSAHEHEQTPPRMACYLTRMPELVSDLFGAANENKKKQQLQQKPATAESTAAGAGMST